MAGRAKRSFGLAALSLGLALACSALGLWSCGPGGPPPQPPPEPDPLLARFGRDVAPVLEARCAGGCHDVDAAGYADFIARPGHAGAFYFPVERRSGRIPRDPATLEITRRAAIGPAGHENIAFGEDPAFSELLRRPLSESMGGTPHAGFDVFHGADDPGYRALRGWIVAEQQAEPRPLPALNPELEFFRDHVLGVMERNSCFLASCHGPMVFNDLKLQPPLPAAQGDARRYSRAMVLANREAMLGAVCRFTNLGGDLKQSRIILKNLPIREGGIHQRGGNDQFFENFDDPDVGLLLEWLGLERRALARRLRSGGEPVPEAELGRLRGVAFIRGPRHAPRKALELEPFYPGSDIWLQPQQGEPFNLTARFHDAPVEIQALDVRYDARAIVFSMRRAAGEGFRLYELRLDDALNYMEGSFRQLSFDDARTPDGTLIHHVDPCYIPGPADREGVVLDDVGVAYASNAAVAWAACEPWGILGEADGGGTDRLLDAQRTEAPGSFEGREIAFVAGPGKGQTRVIARHLADGAGSVLVFDRPIDFELDRRSVYVIEHDGPAVAPSFDIWSLVPSDPQASRRRMTFTHAQERRPTMRTNGEVMFTSVRNLGFQDGKPVYNGAIFRVHAGGWDYHIHGGNRSRYPLYFDSRELPGGLEVRLALDPRNLWGGGVLVVADHGFGVNVEPDNPVDHFPYAAHGEGAFSGVRFLPAQHTLLPETGESAVTVTGRSPGGAFRDPYPLPDGRILVARAPGFDHLDPRADPDWDIAVLRFPRSIQSEDGLSAGPVEIETLACSSPGFAEYCPRPLLVRLKETPSRHQKFSQRGDLAEPREDFGVSRVPAGTPADIECYDYPLLEAFLTNFAPLEPRRIRGTLPRGDGEELRFVRIIAQDLPGRDGVGHPEGAADPFATRDGLGVRTRARIVAEVPLEPDGSFYAAVPPEQPLILQGLNGERMALHSMNRWFYTQPGERLTFAIPRPVFPTRCAGCHGSLTGAPHDQLGPPDIATASSRVMANWDPTTRSRRRPVGAGYAAPARAEFGVDFRRDVQPILDAKCVSCHGEGAALDLRGAPTRHFTVSYESLHRLEDPASRNFAAKRYINEREALAVESWLIEVLSGRELKAPRALFEAGPHPAQDPLTAQELLTLARWIDLGATFRGGGG
jgi:hypothetical protein